MALSGGALLNAEGMTCNSHGHESMVKERQTPPSPEGTTGILSEEACLPSGTSCLYFAVTPD